MGHKIVNNLHIITDKKGHVNVYTEEEYQQLSWWNKVKKTL